MAETTRRTLRFDDPRWEGLREIATHRNTSITAVVEELVDRELAQFYAEVPLEDRIRIAYIRFAKAPNDWVPLAELRWWLADVGRQLLDFTLLELHRVGVVRLAPVMSRARTTQEDHNAALTISTVDNHLFRVDNPPASTMAE